MLSLSGGQRYYVYSAVCDMRCGFDSLSGIVRQVMKCDVMGGDVFVFFNKKRSHIKLLQWDQDGFALYTKRLESGRFESLQNNTTQITGEELLCILRGLSLKNMVRRKRYKHAS